MSQSLETGVIVRYRGRRGTTSGRNSSGTAPPAASRAPGRSAAVYRNLALRVRQDRPRVGFDPDICVVEPPPPKERADKEIERAAKQAALRRVAELEAELARKP